MVNFPGKNLLSRFLGGSRENEGPSAISVNDLQAANFFNTSGGVSTFDGSKYFGGLDAPQFIWTDYWSLRLHSAKLFKENLYARGLIRRLVTNEIATGLSLEAIPSALILNDSIPGGFSEDQKNEWSELVESRFQIWGKNPLLCDYKQKNTFGSLQRIARAEALVSGDVLVVLRQSQRMRLPSIQLIPAHRVQTPIGHDPRRGNKILHGVELDDRGRQVAFWILQDNNQTSKRLPAFGERSGRRIAWLVYGTDKRLDDVRGEPILSLVMQSLKEIDRYRDASQRKATVNSMVAMFIEKGENKPGTKPLSGGAVRRGAADLANPDGTTRQFNIAKQLPGLVLEELQQGEKPHAFDSSTTDINFPIFEAAIVHALAWANEIPPEVLTLAFQNNYSASRGAVNEFKIYLDKSRSERAEEFDEPIYNEWLLSEVLVDNIQAPGLLEAWRDPLMYDVFGAWIASDWAGAIKPNIDLKKEVSAYQMLLELGLITYARAARELTGMKYSRTIKQLKTENQERAEALRPLLALEQEFGVKLVTPVEGTTATDNIERTAERTLDLIEGGK
ncbi:phage portal protein [Candidatus Pacearchaeota archaeon]|nr:phage portal protein [Candidatus Pacearchaeota archaeon]